MYSRYVNLSSILLSPFFLRDYFHQTVPLIWLMRP